MTSDHDLLARWASDDADAGGELFARYFPGLFRFFATKVDDEVEDLVQATLLNCVKYRARLEAAESFKAYLYTIARRRLYKYLTTKVRSQAIDFGASSVIDLGGSPSSIVAQREGERRLLAALRALPVELQVLLELHYWEGMTIGESAQVLELPLGTAKTRLRRARTLLRAQLGHSDGPESDNPLGPPIAGPDDPST
ncbi:MAG: sigma-70 family RNA polymerase sigma factor [Myxococcota bacterium]